MPESRKSTDAKPSPGHLRALATRLRRIADEILRDEARLTARLAELRTREAAGDPEARRLRAATATELGRSLNIGGAKGGAILRQLANCEGIEDRRTLETIIEAVDRPPLDERDTRGPDFAVFSHWLHSTFAPCPAYLRRVVRRSSEGYGPAATALWFTDAMAALADHVEEVACRVEAATKQRRQPADQNPAAAEGSNATSTVGGKRTMEDDILDAIRKHGPMHGRELAKKAGLSEDSGAFKRTCAQLARGGKLSQSRKNGYSLPS